MVDLATEIQTLRADCPIALLPVRIETRFVSSPTAALLVRVYPDEIFADAHRRSLTAEEQAAAQDYWAIAWEPSNEVDAWRRLVTRFSVPRAAWLVSCSTPTNVDQRPQGQPTFPPWDVRDGVLTDVVARLLPSAWMVLAYRGGAEVHRVTGKEIASPLHLSFRPGVTENAPSLVQHDGLTIERELLWMVDFQAAIANGMAVAVPLSSTDIAAGFDRVVVVGVRTGVTPDDGAAGLGALLEAHHHTRGVALVRQGTPTNNSEAGPSGYPPPDDPVRSFEIERDRDVLVPGSDGEVLSRALGLPAAPSHPLARIDGAKRREQAAATAMNRALWPCTLGYFLEQMMTPLVTTAQVAEVRAHFQDFVRGRGPLPVMRIGHVPYGILPTTSLRRWQAARVGDTIDAGLVRLLSLWQAQFLARTAAVPRVGATADPDADLLGVLNRDAVSREVRAREVLGPAYVQNVGQLLGIDPGLEGAARASVKAAALAEAGLAGTEPRISGMTLADTAHRIGRSLVASGVLAEEGELDPNYIREVGASSITALRDAGRPDHAAYGNPLLYHLLRQASLVEYGRVGIELAIKHGLAQESDRVERELHFIAPGTETRVTHWQRLAAPVAGVTNGEALGVWLLEPTSSDADRAAVRAHREAMGVLESQAPAELERLLVETLDVCSHRLDAWITSIATRRLAAMRKELPRGVYVGAFGWVENLRRRTAPRAGTDGGFIHAPTAAHAAAAAVLHNAHLTRVGTARDQVAIDLSSRRVRNALRLLDGVRAGLPLGAVLGYRFERAVHDAALDVYIAPFRTRFPLGRDPASAPDEATDRIAARNVVDGVALRAALSGNTTESTIPWAGLPDVATTDRAKVSACLAALEADVDGAADLLLAESVYQTVRGNIDRASATLSSLAGGDTVPAPQIAAMPRDGIAGTHRVAVLLGSPTPSMTWPTATPRCDAEPRLDAWLGWMLGDPANVGGSVSFPDPSSTDEPHRRTVTVTLRDLDLSPLDVVAMARGTDPDGGGELAARITKFVAAHHGARSELDIVHARDGGARARQITFLEALEVARMLGEVIDGGRSLAAGDLLAPGTDETVAPMDAAELLARATAARNRLSAARLMLADALGEVEQALGTLPLDPLRAQLWAVAGFGVRAAIPLSLDDGDALARAAVLAQARAALAEIDRRVGTAATATTTLDGLAALFGGTLPVLPTFVPGNRAVLDAAIASGPTMVKDIDEPRRWFVGAARVRSALGALRLATSASEAMSGHRFDLQVAQVPHAPGRRWFGARFHPDDGAPFPAAGVASVAYARHFEFPPGGAWAGLLLDEWAELIPSAVQQTCFAAHHDSPGAEAPQCVLLAVPPNPKGMWDLTSLIDAMHETLDLAKVRAVDAEQLGLLGLFAPTTYLAANLADDTISADLTGQLIGEVSVVGPE